jgi:hypothetical protein
MRRKAVLRFETSCASMQKFFQKSLDCHDLTTDTDPVNNHRMNKSQVWPKVKGQIICRFHTIKAAAKLCGCHTNSFRVAAHSKGGRVREWLRRNHVKV